MKLLLFLNLFYCLMACNSNNSSSKVAAVDTDSTTTTLAPEPAPKPVKTTASFVLDGHEILAEKKLDFNHDGFEDVVLILKNSQEETISDYPNDNPSLRPMLFLAGDSEGSLALVARNDKAVYCVDCGGQIGDPFLGEIIVDKDFVSLEYSGGTQPQWSRVVTFKYDQEKKHWFLYEDGTETFNLSTATETSKTKPKDLLVSFEDFDIYQ